MYAQRGKSKQNKSRAIANSVGHRKGAVRQSHEFVDKRPEAFQRLFSENIHQFNNDTKLDSQNEESYAPQSPPVMEEGMRATPSKGNECIQRKSTYAGFGGVIQGFEAGAGNAWHVHKNHVKFGNQKGSRIDFKGRTAIQVIKKMKENTSWPWTNPNVVATYKACKNWIRQNIN